MGEARRRKAEQDRKRQAVAASLEGFNKEAFARAIRKMYTATSTRLGVDCASHAQVARAALALLGIEAELRFGDAAWRINGKAPHGVVAHLQGQATYVEPDPEGDARAAPFHAWLVIGDDLVDFTTYQLPAKAAAIDAADGKHTEVEWAPENLWVPLSTVQPYPAVRDGYTAGLYHYRSDPSVGRLVQGGASVDDEDVQTLLMLYNLFDSGAETEIYGPNDFKLSD